jgi:flavodoxin
MKSNKKSLVAYYLREGNNYVAGRIIYLPVGNTEVVAQKIQQLIGAELFEIKTLMDYP